jgi:hypothetical protein
VREPSALDELQAWVFEQRIALLITDPDYFPKYDTLKAVGAKIRSLRAATRPTGEQQ